MKFLCPSCKAKYQISDEKVAGRSVRMKCRKCGFIIPISEVPPAPASIVPGGPADPALVPRAPATPSLGAEEGRSPAPPAAGKAVTPRAPEAKLPSSPLQKPPAAPEPSRPSSTGAKPPSSPGASPAPKRPTLADVKPPKPVGSGSVGAKPPGVGGAGTAPRPGGLAPKPGAAPSKPAQPPPSSPSAAAAPPASRPGAAAPPSKPGAAAPPSKPTAQPAAPPKAALEALLPALDEEEGDGATHIVRGGALADAFGALVGAASKDAPADAAPMTADEWFVGINEVPVGPIKLNELRKRAMLGAVTGESLVWRDGLEGWRPLKTFPELVAVLEESMSSVMASRGPLVASAAAFAESDPFGSGVSPGGVTSPAAGNDDLAAAGLTRSSMPAVAWLGIVVALACGVVVGVVLLGKYFNPPETIVKYVEVRADGGTEPAAGAVATNTPTEAPEVPSATAAKPRSGSGAKSKPSEPQDKGTGLTGLKGLGGLSPSGPVLGSTSSGSTTGGSSAQLDGTQIQATVAKYTGSVKRSCWQPALDSRDPSAPASARVMVTITVGPSGSVQNVTTSGEPRGYPGLASCIAGRVRSWQFPATGGTTTANVPFVFAAQ